jgi:hypothetical protein
VVSLAISWKSFTDAFLILYKFIYFLDDIVITLELYLYISWIILLGIYYMDNSKLIEDTI